MVTFTKKFLNELSFTNKKKLDKILGNFNSEGLDLVSVSRELGFDNTPLSRGNFLSYLRDNSISYIIGGQRILPLSEKFWCNLLLRNPGKSSVDLSEIVGLSPITIRRIYKKLGKTFKKSDSRFSILKKRESTMVSKYGVKNALQLDSATRRLNEAYSTHSDYKSKSTDFWDRFVSRLNNGESLKSLCRECNFPVTSIKRLLEGLGYSWDKKKIIEVNREKIKYTNRAKYGVDYPLQSKSVIDSAHKTMVDRYGTVNPSESSLIVGNRISRASVDKVKWLNDYGYVLLEPFEKLKSDNRESGVWRKYRLRHLRCGTEFMDDIFCLPRCPLCYPLSTHRSFLEDFYKSFIESLSFKVETNLKNIKNVSTGHYYECDLHIPDLHIGFEVNGLYYHSLNGRYNGSATNSKYHSSKTISALNSNIKLYHIWENDNPEIIKSMMESVLGKSPNRIFARDCFIGRPSMEEIQDFFNQNHLHGFVPCFMSLGLYYGGELVSCISFRKHIEGVEIARFASKLHTQVSGGFSRLLKHGESELLSMGYSNLITYADRDWSPDPNQTVYAKFGFKYVGDSGPILRYTNFKEVIDRRTFQKFKLKKLFPSTFNDELTADQILSLNGWYPIYNSGNLKFTKSL